MQPLIEPLYDTRTAHEFLAMLGGDLSPSAYRIVRETWRARETRPGFEERWRKSLEDGVIEGSAAKPVTAGEPKLPEIKLAPASEGIALVLQADPSVWDGRYAGNPWLQECPKPFTKQVWGNALGLNEATARKAGLSDGGRVRISRGGKAIEATVLIQKGPRGRRREPYAWLRQVECRTNRQRSGRERLRLARDGIAVGLGWRQA